MLYYFKVLEKLGDNEKRTKNTETYIETKNVSVNYTKNVTVSDTKIKFSVYKNKRGAMQINSAAPF